MAPKDKPLALKNAPMERAPANELGVVFLFAHVARRLQFRIEEIRPTYPDCIAYRRQGDTEKKVRIEFEFRSSNFKAHRHDPRKCDLIVCWHHDWPDVPKKLEILELKRFFGVSRKVWIEQARSTEFEALEKYSCFRWKMSKHATPGDVVLMYRGTPVSAITDVFVFSGNHLIWDLARWRDGMTCRGEIRRLCRLASPVFLDDMRTHRVLKTASFVRRNMQGKSLQATEYWPYLYDMILERNPAVRTRLSRLRPDKL